MDDPDVVVSQQVGNPTFSLSSDAIEEVTAADELNSVVETDGGLSDTIVINNTPIEEDGEDEEESDEDVVVTIGEIKASSAYPKSSYASTGKIELDVNPAYKGTTIYDLDLASMEEKPWRKPGADITDYFNYGFNEETWNLYCERQKKLRSEFGDAGQEAVNKALFNSISISSSMQSNQHFTTMNTGGRQLVVIGGGESMQKTEQSTKLQPKMVIDLTKPPPTAHQQNVLMRTVIGSAGTVVSSQSLSQVPSSPSSITVKSIDSQPSSPITQNMPAISRPNLTPLTPSISETGMTNSSQNPPAAITSSISVIGASSRQPQPIISQPHVDFTRPPPSFDLPPSSTPAAPTQTPVVQPPQIVHSHPSVAPASSAPPQQTQRTFPLITADLPPGVDDEPEPPGIGSAPPPSINPSLRPSVGNIMTNSGPHFPSASATGGFNPSVPPPVITAQVSSSLSLQGPAMFQQPPSQQFPAQFNTQFGAGYVGQIRPPLGGHPFRPYRPFHERRPPFGDFHYRRFDHHRIRDSSESDDEGDHRRKRRRVRSRSRSASINRKIKREDKESRHHGSREKESGSSKSGRRSGESKEKERKRSSRSDRAEKEHPSEESRKERKRVKREKTSDGDEDSSPTKDIKREIE